MDMVHDSYYTSCFTFANISKISNYKDIGIHWYHLCFCCKPVLIHSFLQKGSLEGYSIFAIDDTCSDLPCFSCDMLPVLWNWLGAAKWFTHAFSRYILETVQNATIPCLPKESYAIPKVALCIKWWLCISLPLQIFSLSNLLLGIPIRRPQGIEMAREDQTEFDA